MASEAKKCVGMCVWRRTQLGRVGRCCGDMRLGATREAVKSEVGGWLWGLGVLDEPIEGDVNVDDVLGRDGVVPDLPAFDLFQAHSGDDLLHGESRGQVVLVREDKDRDGGQGGLADQVVQLMLRLL
eukprot:CAMPEP_0196663270 /NCGR_PEP_ID=MMETSP1086-20130531/52179_1 /TAXON_ID=77921 /ORGANISM="Cyanoptyche  gloeocystis , Strain SAG4.97" /LENGTH=126 /DNA_ID=CAMNT_0041999017 /DNA_START=369 /DNA_END=749 /DNA_ORIENTATION=+